jgi:hypothetical protein
MLFMGLREGLFLLHVCDANELVATRVSGLAHEAVGFSLLMKVIESVPCD